MNNEELKSIKRSMLINDLMIIIFFGALLNLCVMVTNDSKMPVYFETTESIPSNLEENYIPFTKKEEVKKSYLSDIIIIPFGSKHKMRASIGDILMISGICSVLFIFSKSIFINIKGRLKNGIVTINGWGCRK